MGLLCFSLTVLLGISCVIGAAGYRRYRLAVESEPLAAVVLAKQSAVDYVSYDELSPYFVDALTAVEDRRFFEREGIDWIAFGRALVTNFFAGKVVEGGSTISQQVAKNLYFNNRISLSRKAAEIFLMFDLEKLFSKEEIFALYANIIYYGDGYTGIRAASLGYFGVEADELNLQQASLLAGLPQSPSRYQLSNGWELALRRQKVVLQAMVECGMIDDEERQQALEWDLDEVPEGS